MEVLDAGHFDPAAAAAAEILNGGHPADVMIGDPVRHFFDDFLFLFVVVDLSSPVVHPFVVAPSASAAHVHGQVHVHVQVEVEMPYA